MKKEKGLKSESQKTVISLINILEINNCKPVLARNYENFPNFSNDLDLFVENNSEINNYFCSVAKNLSWDNLTKCEHFSIYRNKVFNITAYKFLKLNPPQTLHVDLFGGFCLLGIPLIDNVSICKNRLLEPKGRFYTMEPAWENGYRLFQIESLDQEKHKERIERYRKRILDFNKLFPKELIVWGEKNNLGDLGEAIAALNSKDMISFNKKIKRAKLIFLIKNIFQKPLLSISNLIDRSIGINKQFKLDPCGPLLHLPCKSKILIKDLDKLVESQFLPGWSDTRDQRERGWAYVKFSKVNKNKIEFKELINLVVKRHKVIYSSQNFKNKILA